MGNRIGIALGGGAARGWAHIGVIETLIEGGVEPVIVSGTSVGALVGGAFASGRLDALRQWALAVNWRTIASLTDVSLGSGGLVDGGRIQRFLVEMGLDQPIERLPVRFAAVATHLLDGREIWLQSGALDAAIRASIAMPGIISPCHLDGRWLVDGGLVNQIPVSTCRALGADYVIAVGVGEGLLEKHAASLRPVAADAPRGRLADFLDQVPEPFRAQADRLLAQFSPDERGRPSYFGVLTTALSIMQEKITRSRLAGEPPHVMIAPKVSHISLMDFDHAAEAIEAGRAAATRALEAIRADLARPS